MSDITELFARDPEKLTKSDLAEIIAYYREARQRFAEGERQAGSAKKPAKGQGLKVTNLKDLNLDL